ncbi:MAG: DEAD/DEAH box helicase family protein [Oscillospiraceae bacterium]|nr:DEAD/DEAH box helicase family protein [Oscillospiraceae bacterium]
MIAQIAVSSAVYAMDKPYAYLIPAQMERLAAPGVRVMAPFGRGNRRLEGMILSVSEQPDAAMKKLKTVEKILDETPVLSQEMLRLAAFLRDRYFCTFYDAVRAILPAGVWLSAHNRYAVAPDAPEGAARSPVAQSVLQAVRALGGSADERALRKQFQDEPLQKALRILLDQKLLISETDLMRRVGDKTEQIATLAASADDALSYAASKRRAAPLQAAVLEMLASIGSGCVKEICYFTGATAATFRRLETLGYLALSAQPILRRPEIRPDETAEPVVLNAEQQVAFDGLSQQASRPEPGVALLYGVTGSGKTAVYLRLIAQCLAAGKSAMLLVPEIALTPQLLSLFAAHFGDQVAVLHSSLRVGERYDEWKRIRSGAARLVIGTRSAVFAPANDLGLILLDEEQEHTYKSENTPRYHAREIAI